MPVPDVNFTCVDDTNSHGPDTERDTVCPVEFDTENDNVCPNTPDPDELVVNCEEGRSLFSRVNVTARVVRRRIESAGVCSVTVHVPNPRSAVTTPELKLQLLDVEAETLPDALDENVNAVEPPILRVETAVE